MTNESASIKAIELTKKVFEYVHGNLGLLKFNIEELTATNGSNGEESKKWDIICSFYETLGSQAPSRYKVSVNLNDNTVVLKKIDKEQDEKDEPEKRFTIIEKKEPEKKEETKEKDV